MNHTNPQQLPTPRAINQHQPTPIRRPIVRAPIPETNADVAMIDVNGVASLSCMSHSWIWNAAAKGEMPKPVRLGARCTRWRLAEIRTWLAERAQTAEGGQA